MDLLRYHIRQWLINLYFRLIQIYPVTYYHLEGMFRVDGFKQYAWRKAKELDAQEGGMFAGIKDALAARVATKKEEA